MIPGVLLLLDAAEHPVDELPLVLTRVTELPYPLPDGRSARQFGQQDVGAVSNRRRVYMLESSRVALHRGHVHPAFVGERVVSHVRLVRVGRYVAEFGHEPSGYR